ncbi:MAG: MATE family efflux transporter, partial [Angelakisella sp.]
MTKALGNPGQKMVIRKRIFAMIFPIVIENVLQLLASLVSMGMLGRISTIAVSAQGVASLLTGIIWNLFKGITIGATVLIANAYGAQDEKRIRVVAQQTLLSLVAVAFVLQFIVRWSARPLLSLFNPDPVIMDNALIYLKTVTYGFPFLAVMLCVTGFLQGKGDAKTPMYIALIMNVVNIIVSSVLIFGWFGIPQQGLRGSALGLICSEISGAICGFYVLFRKGGMLHKAFTRENFSFQPKVIAEVFRVGFPSALETIFWHMASIILSRVMLSFGDVAFAAN